MERNICMGEGRRTSLLGKLVVCVAFAECRGVVDWQALVDRIPSHARGNKVGERKWKVDPEERETGMMEGEEKGEEFMIQSGNDDQRAKEKNKLSSLLGHSSHWPSSK
jgi:hypothetical protein